MPREIPVKEATEAIDTREVDCILVKDGEYRYVYSDTKEPVEIKPKGE